MNIVVFHPDQFSELESTWKKLESGKDMTVFQHYDWYKHINNLYEKEKAKRVFRKWIYILVKNNDEPILIAPIQIVRVGLNYKNIGISRGAYFIGREGYTDYLNFIYKEFSEEATAAVFDYLKTQCKVKKFIFEQILESTEFYHFILSRYYCIQSEVYCASLLLPDTFDEYTKKLSKSSRQNIRTAINRQNRDNIELTHEMVYELDDITADNLMFIRGQRLIDKKKKSRAKASKKGKIYLLGKDLVKNLFSAKHDIIRENCSPWFFLVKHQERVVGFFWGMKNDDQRVYYVVLGGVDKDYAWYSPSTSHLYLFIKEMYEKNNVYIRELDFTRGGEKYKADLGGEKKPTWTVRFEAMGFRK